MDFSLADFNYFDITIGAIVLILGLKGFMSGFIKESFGLAGLVGGVYFGSRFAPDAARFIDTNFVHIDNTSILTLLGFLAILGVIWIGATLLGSIFSKLISLSGLGFLNSLLGFIIGGGKYFIIFSLIITALSNIALVKDKLEAQTKESVIFPYLQATGTYLINLDPTAFGVPEEVNAPSLPSPEELNNTLQTLTEGS